MKRAPARYCTYYGCGILLIRGYAELDGGWAVAHEGGGAHNVLHPHSTGRVFCGLHFNAQRPPKSRAVVPSVCTDCHEAPVRYRQLLHAWTQVPATKAVHDPKYGALHLCEPCFIKRLSGEQLVLFDG